MPRHTHLNMEQEIREELQNRAKIAEFDGTPSHIQISEENGTLLNEAYGPQQVESLLRYTEDPLLTKGLADAENIADAEHHLIMLKKNRVIKKD